MYSNELIYLLDFRIFACHLYNRALIWPEHKIGGMRTFPALVPHTVTN